jgi:TonB family protein
MRAGWAIAALVASVGLHGVAAWGILRNAPVPVAPTTRVVVIDVVEKTSGGPGQGSSAGRRHARKHPGRIATPTPTPTVIETPTPTSVSTATSLVGGIPSSGRGIGGGTVAGSGHALTGSGIGSGASTGSGAGLDLAPFLERLRRSAVSCAPRRRSHDGTATAQVRFCVGAGGAATSVALLESTGSGELDRAAIDCVVPGAAPFPPIDRCLVVPLRFQ